MPGIKTCVTAGLLVLLIACGGYVRGQDWKVGNSLSVKPTQDIVLKSRIWSGISISPSGQIFATDDRKGIVWLYDLAEPRQPIRFQHGEVFLWAGPNDYTDKRAVHVMRFSRDESRLLIADTLGIAKLWDLKTHQEIARFDHKQESLKNALFVQDEQSILTWGKNAYLWSIKDQSKTRVFRQEGEILGAKLTRDESRLITWASGGGISIWSLQNQSEPLKLYHGRSIRKVLLTEDEKVLVSHDDINVRLWLLDSGDELNVIRVPTIVKKVVLTSDNQGLIVLCGDGQIRRWSVDDSDLTHELKAKDGVQWLHVARTRPIFLYQGDDNEVNICRTDDLSAIARLPHGGRINCTRWIADESRLLTGCSDGVIRLWSIPGGEMIWNFRHRKGASSWRLNADESRLLTYSREKVEVWDLPKKN